MCRHGTRVPAVRNFLADFVAETNNELFPTREACIEFYRRPENFVRLERGEIGDNLMYKYRAIASFHLWPEICATAMDATRKIVEDHGFAREIVRFDEFWSDFHAWMKAGTRTGELARRFLRLPPPRCAMTSMRGWRAGDYANPRAYSSRSRGRSSSG